MYLFIFLRFQVQGSSRPPTQSFFKEVILLPNHKATHLPRRAQKAWLFENGHIKSALEFGCDWDSDTVLQAITVAFQPAMEGCRYILKLLLIPYVLPVFIGYLKKHHNILYYKIIILSICVTEIKYNLGSLLHLILTPSPFPVSL